MNASIKEYVLWAIADDYESLDLILGDLKKWAQEDGLIIAREGVIAALGQLIEEASARAYVLAGQPPYATVVKLSENNAQDLWFYATEKGKSLVEEWIKTHPIGTGLQGE
jgi:hypothetical protein